MSLALITSTAVENEWWRFGPFIPWRDMLQFPIEAQGVLKPFREQVLRNIYRTALDLSEGLLESATVEAVSEPDEEDSLHLHLALTINSDWQQLDKLHDQILARVAEWSKEWSLENQEEYGRWIFFSLTLSHI